VGNVQGSFPILWEGGRTIRGQARLD